MGNRNNAFLHCLFEKSFYRKFQILKVFLKNRINKFEFMLFFYTCQPTHKDLSKSSLCDEHRVDFNNLGIFSVLFHNLLNI